MRCLSVDLFIQHAKRMRRIILSSVASKVLQYFSTLFFKRHDSQRKNVKVCKMCALIFSANFLRKTSYAKKNSARYDHKCT